MPAYHRASILSINHGDLEFVPSQMCLDLSTALNVNRKIVSRRFAYEASDIAALLYAVKLLNVNEIPRIIIARANDTDIYASFICQLYERTACTNMIVVLPVLEIVNYARMTKRVKTILEYSRSSKRIAEPIKPILVVNRLHFSSPAITILSYLELLDVIESGLHFYNIASLVLFSDSTSNLVENILKTAHALSNKICVLDI